MTIFEYLTMPHPWLDTSKYTPLQIGMFFVGSLLWLTCYIDTLRDIIKKKTLNIPLMAIVLNFGWEVATCWFFVPDMGKLLVIAYWAWMLVDAFIFYSTFRYGFKQLLNPYFAKRIGAFLILGILISFSSQLTFILGYDLPMAPLSGYLINLVMSISFLYLVFIPGYEGNSLLTAWTKFLGTGIISVMFFTKYPTNNFLTVMYIAVAIFDILYIYLLYNRPNTATA